MNRGGSESMIMEVYRNIDRDKIQFDFVVHIDESCDFDREIEELGGKTYRVPPYTIKNHITYKKAFNELFRANKNAWIVLHGHAYNTAFIYLSVAKKYGLHTIIHSHNTSRDGGMKGIMKDFFRLFNRKSADHYFACSNAAGKFLYGDKNCSANNYYLFKNAVDAKKLIFSINGRAEIRRALSLEEKLVIGHVGSFKAQKNHEFLISIFNEIHKREKNAVLLLIGDGELRGLIEEKACSLNLSDSVLFLGVRPDIPDILQAMDIFLFPSLYEGLGIALIEAQASGLPSLASDTIPQEVKLVPELEMFSLNKTASEWADKLLSMREFPRRDTYNEIVRAGYDIKDNVKWLENYYLKMSSL
jgi:glycosyltransferase involved in cell wall biosynthesis